MSIYLANLTDGSVIEYQEKTVSVLKIERDFPLLFMDDHIFSPEDNRMWLFDIPYCVR